MENIYLQKKRTFEIENITIMQNIVSFTIDKTTTTTTYYK
jgi:hypothetical protein